MTKYCYLRPIIIGVSIAIWAGSVYAVKANGIEDATIYGIDRTVCSLNVPQEWINKALSNAAIENGWSINQTVDTVAGKIVKAQGYMADKPLAKVVEYCNSRKAR